MFTHSRVYTLFSVIWISSIFWWYYAHISWLFQCWWVILWAQILFFLFAKTTDTQKANIRSFVLVPCTIVIYMCLVYALKNAVRWYPFVVVWCIFSLFWAIDMHKQQHLEYGSRQLSRRECLYICSLLTGGWVAYMLFDIFLEEVYFYAWSAVLSVYVLGRLVLWTTLHSLEKDIYLRLLIVWLIVSWCIAFFPVFFHTILLPI